MKTTFGVILFPICCLLLSFFVLITDPGFTYLGLEQENIEPTKQLLQNFEGKGELPLIFDEAEQAHLRDVRNVIWKSLAAFVILTILLVLLMIKGDWQKIVQNGTILLVAILILSAIVPFDQLFTNFHNVFFPQGNWMFFPSSVMVQMYPRTFFMNYGIAIALHSILVAILGLYVIFVARRG